MHTKMVNEIFYAETYSEDDVKQLCEIGEIAPEDLDRFRDDLERIAALYRWEKENREKPTPNSDIKREFLNISKHATRLLSSLESISWQAQNKIDRRAFDDEYKDPTANSLEIDEPTLSISVADLETDTKSIIIDVPMFRSLLGGLVNASIAEAANMPPGKSGKIPSWGLKLWMNNIETLWTETTDQPFSRDVTSSNEPITNAARFCVAAFQIVDPQCTASLIMKEMKERIKYILST